MIKKQIQILHISDIHLDNEIGSGKEKSAAQIGLESSIDAATENNVDLILLAGDLFDHNRKKLNASILWTPNLGDYLARL